MPLEEAMETQRAIRRLKPEPVDDALVLRLIELALKAPTGGKAQGWEFIVVKDREVKERLARLNRQALRIYGGIGRIAMRKRPEMQRVLDAVQWQADHFAEIPVVVVACLRGIRIPVPPVAATSYYGSIYPAVQNLLARRPSGGSRGGAHSPAPLEHLARTAGTRAAVERHPVRRRSNGLAAGTVRADDAQACREGRPRRPVRSPAVPGRVGHPLEDRASLRRFLPLDLSTTPPSPGGQSGNNGTDRPGS